MKSLHILGICLLTVHFANSQVEGSITLDLDAFMSSQASDPLTAQLTAANPSPSLFGSLVGDFTDSTNGQVFDITGGSMSGGEGVLPGSNADAFDVSFTGGQLKFYTSGAQSIGGWIDYTIQQNGADLPGGTGTLFFHFSQSQWSGSLAGHDLSLDMGGSNWVSRVRGGWDFLAGGEGHEGLNYEGYPDSNPDDYILLRTGVDGRMNSQGELPEPTSLLVWGGLLAFLGLIHPRRRIQAA